MESLQGKGIAACVKHFAANNQETRRMSGSSNMDERTLYEVYLPALKQLLRRAKPEVSCVPTMLSIAPIVLKIKNC